MASSSQTVRLLECIQYPISKAWLGIRSSRLFRKSNKTAFSYIRIFHCLLGTALRRGRNLKAFSHSPNDQWFSRESSRFSNCDIKKSQFIAANDTLWKSMEIQQFAFENGPLISMSYLVNLVIFQLANCSIVRSKYSDLLPWKMGPQSKPHHHPYRPYWPTIQVPVFPPFLQLKSGKHVEPHSILSHPIGSKPHQTPIFFEQLYLPQLWRALRGLPLSNGTLVKQNGIWIRWPVFPPNKGDHFHRENGAPKKIGNGWPFLVQITNGEFYDF